MYNFKTYNILIQTSRTLLNLRAANALPYINLSRTLGSTSLNFVYFFMISFYNCKALTAGSCYIFSAGSCYIFSVVPQAVGNVIIVPSIYHLNVTWEPPAIPNGVIRNYTVQWRLNSDSNYNSAVTKLPKYTIDNLMPQHLYCVCVAPSTIKGQGPFTEDRCANTTVTGTCSCLKF